MLVVGRADLTDVACVTQLHVFKRAGCALDHQCYSSYCCICSQACADRHAAMQEIRRIWVGYMSQCDPKLGQKVAQKLQSAGAL